MSSPAVKLEGCELRGTRIQDVDVFWGIPYARAPKGALRLAPPEPATLPRVLHATEPRASAPQPVSKIGARLGLVSLVQDEDCLHLNVWTKGKPGDRRPVLVWIHGGSFDAGNATTSVTHAHHLVKRTGAVVVGIQYRLGAMGFLSVPGVPDNRGLLDQIEALRFVQRHIAELGGDPTNVTLVGWSAGGISALLLSVTPEAKGLFRRVVSQSGHVDALHPERAARRVREALFVALGWPAELAPDDARRRLESVSIADLIAAQSRAEKRLAGSIHGLPFLPTMGRVHPFSLFGAGQAAGIDFMIGCTREEYKLARLAEIGRKFDDDALRREVSGLLSNVRQHEPLARMLIDAYRSERGPKADAHDLWSAIASDFYFRYPAWRVARAAANDSAVFFFDVAFRSRTFGGFLGASHGIEIPLLFGTYEDPVMTVLLGDTSVARAVSPQVQDAWGAFARDGVPVRPSGEPWPRLGAAEAAGTIIDETWATNEDIFRFERTTWGPHWPVITQFGATSSARFVSLMPQATR